MWARSSFCAIIGLMLAITGSLCLLSALVFAYWSLSDERCFSRMVAGMILLGLWAIIPEWRYNPKSGKWESR